MRVVLFLVLAACSVESKHPSIDAGVPTDAPPDSPGDSSAPDTMITQQPAAFSNTAMATFAFTSTDPAATFQCSLDREPMTTCTSPVSRTLADGPHGFVVRAVDSLGNPDDTPAEVQWMIDTVSPDTTITEKPALADNSVTVRFDFTSNEMNVSFECSIDNASFTQCHSGDSFGPLGDGTHTFSVRAKDRAGNVDATPAAYAWTIDTSTPDTEIDSGPDGPVASTTATFTFTSPDAGAGATFSCALDGAAFVTCSSPQTYNNLAEASHRFAVRVKDAVGNSDPTPATRDWIVDLTAPTTSITSGPTGTVASASASFTFTSNESDVTFQCQLDAAGFSACTSPATYMMLGQGNHLFSVRATDAANHTDATAATRSWKVDTIAPNVAITGGPANASTSGPRVTFTFTNTEGATLCSFDSAPLAACTSPVSTNLPAGMHSFRVQATDAAGNMGADTRAWTVACAAPTTAGAAGLLHLDDVGQTVANAVTGGADAVLGNDMTVEPADPSSTAGRFGTALAFDPVQMDHVSWPALLGATAAFTLEIWANADANAGTHDIFVSGDGRIALRETAVSPTTVRFSLTVDDGTGPATTVNSAVVTAGSWHHVLGSLAQPTLRLWVDGVRTELGGINEMTAPSLDSATLGGNYSGSLDELWLAQTAITTDDAALQRYCPL
jgi:hypothetical protein